MLQRIRDRVNGLIASVLFILLAISFTFWGISSYLGSSNREGKVIAKVGTQSIHQPQLDAIWRRAQQQGQVSNNTPPALQLQLRQSLLQQLIDKSAKIESAKSLGLHIGDNYLRQSIASMPEFQANGQFSKDLFMRLLQANQMTQQAFIDHISQQLLVEQADAGLLATDFVLPKEVDYGYSLLSQKRLIRYVEINPTNFASKKAPSDVEIKAYYKQHATQFTIPPQVKVAYVQLSAKEMQANIKITKQQVQQYYKGNPGLAVIPERWKLSQFSLPFTANATDKEKQAVKVKVRNLRTDVLLSRDNFSALASKYNGNSTPRWFTAAQLPAAVAARLRSVAVNSMSSPVQLNNSYAIYKVFAHQPSKKQSLSAVETKIRKQLQQQKLNSTLQTSSSRLVDLTYTNPDTLQPAAKALNLSVKDSDWFSQQKPPEGILSEPKVIAAIFSNEVLSQGNNSGVINLADGSLLVVRVTSHKASQLQPLANVRQQVISALQKQTAQDKAKKLAKQIENSIEKGKSAQAILKENKLSWKTPDAMLLQSTEPSPSVVAAAFALSPGKPAVTTVQSVAGDYTVLQLLKVTSADTTKLSKLAREAVQTRLQSMQQQLTQQVYLQAALANADVKIYAYK